MDLTTFHPVFLFLVLLQTVVAQVEPPTDVKLHCHNLHNVLKWSYDKPLPGLRFRVNVGSTDDMNGIPNELWVDPPAKLEADVSFLSDPGSSYFLTVTAVIGQNVSHAVPDQGIIFSYFKDSQANQRCSLDFPSVNVTAQQDDTVLLRFTHPWLVYHHRLPRSRKTNAREKKSQDAQNTRELPVFYYDVVLISQEQSKHHNCVKDVCEEKLQVDATQKKHCLKVKGELLKIAVKGTREYCAPPFEEAPSYLVHICVVGVLLFFSAVSFVLFMVYRKKTSPSNPLPSAMNFKSKIREVTSGALQERFTVAEVEPTSPTPLLSSEEKELSPALIPSTEPDVRLRIGVSEEDEGVSNDMEVRNDDYMQGKNFEEDDDPPDCSEVPSDYEKRQVLVKLAPDELAEGYRG
ncbi:growth/differentiation factor 10b [Cottoperca gobio]|uniref:Growth/differentiation factor 10b n=1 Tax=Cottoperca gobio TaxID=56716 RepID=A0A6J2R5E3_COTGO|nr:interferon gamma receptor 1-like [Cottoperca gobio]